MQADVPHGPVLKHHGSAAGREACHRPTAFLPGDPAHL